MLSNAVLVVVLVVEVVVVEVVAVVVVVGVVVVVVVVVVVAVVVVVVAAAGRRASRRRALRTYLFRAHLVISGEWRKLLRGPYDGSILTLSLQGTLLLRARSNYKECYKPNPNRNPNHRNAAAPRAERLQG